MTMDGVYIMDATGVRLVLSARREPDPGNGSDPVSTLVHASVCGQCGFVELWANRPQELWDAYQQAAQAGEGAPPT
jgi:hypothetical protein